MKKSFIVVSLIVWFIATCALLGLAIDLLSVTLLFTSIGSLMACIITGVYLGVIK